MPDTNGSTAYGEATVNGLFKKEGKPTAPSLAATFKSRMAGELPDNWESTIPSSFPSDPTPTRKSNNLAISKLLASGPTFMVGIADLTPSVNLTWPSHGIFNPPLSNPSPAQKAATKAATCTSASVNTSWPPSQTASPPTPPPSSPSPHLLNLYAAPAVRMGAQKLKVIHVATHDSIGAGEDGPTHQPVELAALYRALPNMQYIRPGDSEEGRVRGYVR